MTGFSSQWLGLREPVDHAARSEEIIAGVAGWFARDTNLRITDIGSGTGSTLRALKPVLNQKLSWHLIDHDDALLEVAREQAEGDKVEFSLADLSKSLDSLFDSTPDLITTSAFLDLVSQDWLEWMVGEITTRKIPFYAALTYDGRAGCEPELASDKHVLEAFNQHMTTDKGFGQALGAEAADTAIHLFKKAGYQVDVAESDWIGNSRHKDFQKMLLEGWRNAAIAISAENKPEFENWYAERVKMIDNEDATVFVGHKDIFAVPA